MNLHSIVFLNVKKLLAWSRRHIWGLCDSNENRTHNHLAREWKLYHLAKLAKRLSCLVSIYLYGAFDCMLLSYHVRVSEWSLGAKWLWVPFPLLSHKLQILRLLWARSSLTFRQTTECRFTLKFVCDMMKKYIVKSTVQISTHNTAQSFGQSG